MRKAMARCFSIATFSIAMLIVPCGAATIAVQPATITVNPGQTVSLDVFATGVTDLYAFQFDVTFNPAILSATGVAEGAFLLGGGTTGFVPGAIDNVAGTILFTADTLLGAGPGVSGNGVLATLKFTALGTGASLITLSNITLLDSTLTDIAATSRNGSVTVSTASSVPEPVTAVLIPAGLLAALVAKRRLKASPPQSGS